MKPIFLRSITIIIIFMFLLATTTLPLKSFGADGSANSTSASTTEPSVTAGSCWNPAGGFCNEFTGTSYTATTTKRICDGQGLRYLPGTCPPEGQLGTCLMYKGLSTESKYHYYTNFPGFRNNTNGSIAAAKDQCSNLLKGEWVPERD